MKDRFVVIGCFTLLVAAVITGLSLAQSSPLPDAEPALPTTLPTPAPTATLQPDPEVVRQSIVVPVQLDGVPGAGAFARPGDHVDLIAYFPANVADQPFARVLLRDALVMDTGAAASGSDSTLTISTSPDQAIQVVSAATLGIRPFAVVRSAKAARADAPEVDQVSDVDLRPAPSPGADSIGP